MSSNATLSVTRWETGLSDRKLYFDGLTDSGDALRLNVVDEEGNRFEVVFEQPDLYRVADEALLIHYWSEAPEGGGSTLKVSGAGWSSDMELRDVLLEGGVGYLIVTDDACVEVFANREPSILAL